MSDKFRFTFKIILIPFLFVMLGINNLALPQDKEKSYKFRASDVIGVTVINPNNDTLGEIDDLIVTDGDSVLFAVLSVGGFLGIGDKLITVPYDDLWISKSKDGEIHVSYDANEEQLEAQDTFVYKDGEMTWRSRQAEEREELMAELREQQEELEEEQQDVNEELQEVEEIKEELQEKPAG